jgi:hypothetical protein
MYSLVHYRKDGGQIFFPSGLERWRWQDVRQERQQHVILRVRPTLGAEILIQTTQSGVTLSSPHCSV